MSKGGKKDKKGDNSSALEQQYQMQKRQLLDCQFSLKKLQERLNDLTQQNSRLRNNINEAGQHYSDTIEELTIKNMANEKRLLGLSKQKTQLQIQNQQKQNKNRLLQKNLFDEQQGRAKEMQQTKKNFYFQFAKYESQLSEYKLYMNERDQLQQQRESLIQKVQMQKASKLRQIADKQRQKVQATDKIKDEMNHKVKDMEKNLVSLKREQLQTTTRLTMLQNHQLTSELEYQSKQTEKLIFKNEEFQQKITALKQQLVIHKQVEDQLAKRSHFSKGVIRKLNLRINELQNQIQQLKNALCLPGNLHNSYDGKSKQVYQPSSQKISMNQSNQESSNLSNKRLIATIEQQLQKSQRKNAELYIRYENLQRQKESLSTKLRLFEHKANQLYKVMQKYYDQVILGNASKQDTIADEEQKTQLFKENQPPYEFNLRHLRDVPVQNWKPQDLVLTMQILLNIVQPYLVRSNLVVPSVRKNIVLSDGFTSRKLEHSSKSLPKLSTQRKETYQNKVQQMPVNIASKIVGSNLRQWGQTVKLNKVSLKRKYKVAQSFRN